MAKNKRNQDGFSLIELAIVIIISGVLLAAAATSYKQYLEKKRVYTTQAKIDTVNRAIDRFFSEYSRYPCPAPLTLGPNDAGFGIETDCTAINPVGTFVSIGQINDDNDPLTTVATDIRLGAIPFQTLKFGPDNALFGEAPYATKLKETVDIGAEDTIDVFGNKFSYAVTEIQATLNQVPRLGAIRIIDEHPGTDPLSLNPIGNHSDYVIVSHGQKDAGAWSLYGTQVEGGCPASLPDNQEENCDGDDLYVSSLRYDTGANEYDDFVSYRTWSNYFLWDLASVDDSNIYNLNMGNVGIGQSDPNAKLHVFDGNVVADEDAEPNASVLADQYCGFNSAIANVGEDCFLPEMIGGAGLNCDVDADNIGPHDPGNVALTRIVGGVLDCQIIFTGPQTQPNCPAGQFIRGFTYDSTTKTLTADCG